MTDLLRTGLAPLERYNYEKEQDKEAMNTIKGVNPDYN